MANAKCPHCGKRIEFYTYFEFTEHASKCAKLPLNAVPLYEAGPAREIVDRIAFTVPWRESMSLNQVYGWRRTKLREKFEQAISEYELQAGPLGRMDPGRRCLMRITVHFDDLRKAPRDETNMAGYAKVIEDACVRLGLMQGDSRRYYAGAEVVIGEKDRRYPRVTVEIGKDA